MTADRETLARSYPFKPFAGYPGLSNEEIEENFLVQLQRQPRKVERENALLGWTHLAWDSEVLGLNCARIDWLIAADRSSAREVVKAFLADAQAAGDDYIIARVPSADMHTVQVLEEMGFILLDGLLTFARKMPIYAVEPPEGLRFSLAIPEDAEELAPLGKLFGLSRFRSDPLIPSECADHAYAEWIRNSVHGSAADCVVICRDDEGVAGFVTCRIRTEWDGRIGTIPLVVATREGKGVGYHTTIRALQWFEEQGVQVVDVGTQLANVRAGRLYENCGFRLVDTSLTLRWASQSLG